jgi:hypothetical protein
VAWRESVRKWEHADLTHTDGACWSSLPITAATSAKKKARASFKFIIVVVFN